MLTVTAVGDEDIENAPGDFKALGLPILNKTEQGIKCGDSLTPYQRPCSDAGELFKPRKVAITIVVNRVSQTFSPIGVGSTPSMLPSAPPSTPMLASASWGSSLKGLPASRSRSTCKTPSSSL